MLRPWWGRFLWFVYFILGLDSDGPPLSFDVAFLASPAATALAANQTRTCHSSGEGSTQFPNRQEEDDSVHGGRFGVGSDRRHIDAPKR